MNIYKGQLMATYGTLAHRADVLEAIIRELSANELNAACERDGLRSVDMRNHANKLDYLLALHPDDAEVAIGRCVVLSILEAVYPISLETR